MSLKSNKGAGYNVPSYDRDVNDNESYSPITLISLKLMQYWVYCHEYLFL